MLELCKTFRIFINNFFFLNISFSPFYGETCNSCFIFLILRWFLNGQVSFIILFVALDAEASLSAFQYAFILSNCPKLLWIHLTVFNRIKIRIIKRSESSGFLTYHSIVLLSTQLRFWCEVSSARLTQTRISR